MKNGSMRNRSMEYFRSGERNTLLTGRISGGIVAITRLKFDGVGPVPVGSPDVEDALLLHYHLRPQVGEISIDGRSPVPLNTPCGQINLLDFRQRLGGQIFEPFDMVGFHLPFAAFGDLGPEYGRQRLDGASIGLLDAAEDVQVRGLVSALLPLLDAPGQANRLFLDHVGWALVAHVGQRYGSFSAVQDGRHAPLASWQWRLATEMIDEDLSGRVRLADLAAACRLPIGRFARAFKATAGMAPHEWLLLRRVDRAKSLLASSDLPLSQVASECGFSDQSHMTRVFARIVGHSPGRWRNAG